MRWSVSIVAEGDRVVNHDEVVELADAVAAWSGIASGMGSQYYGAQLVVEAEDRDTAVRRGADAFVRAAAQAGLPSWPITEVGAISEAEDQLGYLE
ncbi:hypothetical protein HC028_23355 [Planosporangium flavigriseum]|uniref:Uncharacterized protein n=1 Tax=Planosporangium flavigriseum TaxID=373681 RepID=A0A8J3LNH6_9ACTN|nr:hypothetical protein [Planosporangium flavigriseum]NJC67414.1 hypothetical protein [Planosporangium flavigriseum]GIG74947.1 hypothetical protein Pfl04_33510 [Planosporangium flavigriseum]